MTTATPTLDTLDAAVDGALVLDELVTAIRRYVALPSPAHADAIALWIAATHAQPCWEHATRLVIKSPVKRSGKTRLQEITAELCHRPFRVSNASTAALVHAINESDPPTFLLDEADAVFKPGRGSDLCESAEALRGILNAGFGRGASYLRWDPKARAHDEAPTFAMACIAAIGDLPDTIEDRAIVVTMQRRAPDEVIEPFRRRHIPGLHAIRDRLRGWIVSVTQALRDAEPAMPVDDREADVWEPLVAVADAAGGDWPERARAACLALTAATSVDDEATLSERLLADLWDIFGDKAQLTTREILGSLHDIEEAPWQELRGRPMTARDLARLLRPYGVKSRNLKQPGGDVVKGYLRKDLDPVFARYLRYQRYSATEGENAPAFEPETEVADTTAPIRYQSATGENGAPGFENTAPGGAGSGVAAVAAVARAGGLSLENSTSCKCHEPMGAVPADHGCPS